jgi:hypothetical protein
MDDTYNEDDEFDMIAELTSTIDALNANIILLNRFISSAYNLSNTDNRFKENVEITTFDESGNIISCVKSDGSGNFMPCVHVDASGNMIPCVLPPMPEGIGAAHVHINSEKKTRGFGHFGHYPRYPYHYPPYGPHYPYYPPYGPHYPYYGPYGPYYNGSIHRPEPPYPRPPMPPMPPIRP